MHLHRKMGHLIKALIQHSEAQNKFLINSESQKHLLQHFLEKKVGRGHFSYSISMVVVPLSLWARHIAVWVGAVH